MANLFYQSRAARTRFFNRSREIIFAQRFESVREC